MNRTVYIPKYHGAGMSDSYAIQTIIVKKPISLKDAKAKAAHILKKQKMMHREKTHSTSETLQRQDLSKAHSEANPSTRQSPLSLVS